MTSVQNSLEFLVIAFSQLQKDTQVESSIISVTVLCVGERKSQLEENDHHESGSHRVDFESPGSAIHVEWLAVDLFSLVSQLAVRVDLEDTGGVAGNHLTGVVEAEIMR